MPKINPADAETARILKIQSVSAARTRAADRLAVTLAAALLFVFGILLWALPRESFSEDENRTLADLPAFSAQSVSSGKFTSGIADFYSDHFPLRRYFVGAKAVLELGQLKMQNNGVIPGSGGVLVKRLEYTDYTAAEKNLDAIKEFGDALDAVGIPLTVAFAPRSIDVYADSLNPLWGDDRAREIWNVITESGLPNTDLRSPLAALAGNGEYVWYRTDHHWTTRGAYEAYKILAGQLGYTAMPQEYFTVEEASDSFRGTTYSSSGMYATPPDTIEYYRFPGDDSYTVENVLTEKTQSGFYMREYLNAKDKYSSFLGMNSAHLSVVEENGGEDKPTLLIIKDSFAHSLAPFLAIHFDLEIIDLRFFNGSPAALALESGADAVLILVGADSLAVSDDLTLLRYGLSSFASR